MKDAFLQAYNFTAAYEGVKNGFSGYINHPMDPGGETVAGISRRYHPKWDGWQTVDLLKSGMRPHTIASGNEFDRVLFRCGELMAMVEKFYREEFWERNNIQALESMRAQFIAFDSAVLCGGVYRRWFQDAVNDVHKWLLENDVPPAFLTVQTDGVFGPLTLASVNTCCKNSEMRFCYLVLSIRAGYHFQQSTMHETLKPFLQGWINRVSAIRKEIDKGDLWSS